jgi:hypothetical protein
MIASSRNGWQGADTCQSLKLTTSLSWNCVLLSIASYITNEPRPTNGRPENTPEIPDQPIINHVGTILFGTIVAHGESACK